LARDVGTGKETNFIVNGGADLADINLKELIDLCLAENDRRLAPYDPRLIRPTFVPRMARLARTVLGLGSKRRAPQLAA
jgi:hypothetical protein